MLLQILCAYLFFKMVLAKNILDPDSFASKIVNSRLSVRGKHLNSCNCFVNNQIWPKTVTWLAWSCFPQRTQLFTQKTESDW
jgi:hypothetical protein